MGILPGFRHQCLPLPFTIPLTMTFAGHTETVCGDITEGNYFRHSNSYYNCSGQQILLADPVASISLHYVERRAASEGCGGVLLTRGEVADLIVCSRQCGRFPSSSPSSLVRCQLTFPP